MQMNRSAMFLLGILGMASSEAAVTYGNAIVDRSLQDSWSNFLILETSTQATESGIATTWDVYGKQAGTVASVILTPGPGGVTLPALSPQGVSPPSGFNPVQFQTRYYTVTGVSEHTISQGPNSFDWSPTSGSANVSAGSVFGLWIGAGKVPFDLGSEPSSPVVGYFDTYMPNPPHPQSLYDLSDANLKSYLAQNGYPQNGDGLFAVAPVNGTSYLVTYETPRIYSSSVTVSIVPVPPAFLLFGSVMAGGLVFFLTARPRSV